MSEAEELERAYRDSLVDLTVAKAHISSMTMIAEENKPYAGVLVAAIADHMMRCPPTQRLAVIYLIDSILKNAGPPYIALFSRHVYPCFMQAWETADSRSRERLQRLLNTWGPIFDGYGYERGYGGYGAGGYDGGGYERGYGGYDDGWGGYAGGGGYGGDAGYGQAGGDWGGGYQDGGAQGYGYDGQGCYQDQGGGQGGGWAPPQREAPPPQGAPGGVDASALMDQLVAAGVIGGDANAGTDVAGADGDWTPAAEDLQFDHDALKHGAKTDALRRLEGASAKHRGGILDRLFLRRGSREPHRIWFATVDTWIQATSMDVPARKVEDRGPEPPDPATCSVPVENAEGQTHCALSGEELEATWDDGEQKWVYRGALRLYGEDAEREGVPAGSVVLATCMTMGRKFTSLMNSPARSPSPPGIASPAMSPRRTEEADEPPEKRRKVE
ncbi:unnamed protein product [Pedinophyceae sp. YPF-701]|nr:unnamed protein product [Pedinophyceae sp. YPF-701]